MTEFKYKDLRVLVVDDMATLRESITLLLRAIGFKAVNQAESGKAALRKIETSIEENAPYGLIFSDINMPELNGIDLVRKIKSDDRTKNIPIVMISTENEASIVMDAISAGAVNYLLKPFTSDALRKKIKEIEKFLV